MNLNYTTRFVFTLVIMIFLSGCAHNSFKRFPPLVGKKMPPQDQRISLYCQLYDQKQTREYFGINLYTKGYVPFRIHIENNSGKHYTMHPSYIDIPLVNPKKIAKLISSHASLFLIGAGYISLLFYWPLVPLVIVPSGCIVYKRNKKIKNNISNNTLHESCLLEIPPYGKVDKFMFVAKNDCKSPFTISLFDEVDRTLVTFEITTDVDKL